MGIVTAIVKSEGQELSPVYELVSIEIVREVNRIPFAELVLLDGDAAQQKFPLSDDSFFEPGKAIEIQLRYEGEPGGSKTVFKGLVVRHNLEALPLSSTLTVELRDKAFGMTRGRNNAVFENMTDADIFRLLISAHGCVVGSIPAALPQYEEMVQYQCSDWDFMLSRAQADNLLVTVEDETVGFKKPEIVGSPKHTFEYGLSELFRFEMEADATHQYETIESVSWDIRAQKLTQKSIATDFSLAQGNLKGKSVAQKFEFKKYLLANMTPLSPNERQSWADATMARTRLSLLKGVITVPGFAAVQLLDEMELAGLSKRFNGITLVTGIKHTVNPDGWQTHLQFGLKADAFAPAAAILDAPAAGLLPAVQGLQIGVVDAFKEDSQNELRVRVLLPGIDPEKGQVWARLAGPEAGLGRGYLFRPEKGDEVVVGFFNDDPRRAVILGALFSSKNTPPAPWKQLDAQNALKGIATKTGITLAFNDEDQTLKLLTSENHSILLDEKNKSIEIKDLNDNTITLNDKGISIKVIDKLTIEANGDLELKGKNITIDASANVTIKGIKVDVK
jgi:Rhs element Vgr protein